MKHIAFIFLLVCLNVNPLQAEWTLEPQKDIYGKIEPNGKKIYVWHSPPTEELPKELRGAKPLEAEGPLPTLKISKKQLEAEGYINPLEDFMKVKDRSLLDMKAMRRSLLHHLLTKAQMDEVEALPKEWRSEEVSKGGNLEHYGGVWSERKMHDWLVFDILIIEYLQKRPEKFWKMSALLGAYDLQDVVRHEDLGKLKDTGPIGFAITELYIIPYVQHAVPVACRESMYKTSDILMGIAVLYDDHLKLPVKWHLSFYENAAEMEKPYEPAHHNIFVRELARIYEKEGDIDKAIKALEQWDTKCDQTQRIGVDVLKKLEELKKIKQAQKQ